LAYVKNQEGQLSKGRAQPEDVRAKALAALIAGERPADVARRGIVRLTAEGVIRVFLRHNPRMRIPLLAIIVIASRRDHQPLRLVYFRFALSFRDVEEMLAMRGVVVANRNAIRRQHYKKG